MEEEIVCNRWLDLAEETLAMVFGLTEHEG